MGGLSCQLRSVLGATEIEKEFFPLSGGIDDGVHVTIKVKGIQDDGAKIEFVDRERKAAFTFTVSRLLTKITRSADTDAFNGAVEEDFGGYPADLCKDNECTFTFTKRKFDMAVSIAVGSGSVVRYPWYDYANLQRDGAFPLLTHVAVYAGMVDPEVTLERPTCSNSCHADECRDAAGSNTCTDPAGCFVVKIGDAPGVATECSASTETTPGASMHCCDGEDVTPKTRTPLTVDSWATVSSSKTYIRRVCTAFSLEACADLEALAGTKIKVNESLGSSSYKVFAPASVTERTSADQDFSFPAEAFKTFSGFALFENFENNKVTQALPINFAASDFNADAAHDNILAVQDAGNLTVGMYVHLIKWEFFTGKTETLKSTMVTKYTRKVRDLVTGQSGFAKVMPIVYASEIPTSQEVQCTDRLLNDTNGDDCSKYSATVCTPHGYPTRAGCAIWDPDGTTPLSCRMPGGFELGTDGAKRNVGNNAAALLCCVCGGGDSEAPTSWGPGSSPQLSVVM